MSPSLDGLEKNLLLVSEGIVPSLYSVLCTGSQVPFICLLYSGLSTGLQIPFTCQLYSLLGTGLHVPLTCLFVPCLLKET